MGCSWDTNEINSSDEHSIVSSNSLERLPARKISYPSFSLSNNNHEEREEEDEDDDSVSLSNRREAVQSKASKLMSRKRVYSQDKNEENTEHARPPQRIMLENILDSFDELVDARIRAYARILSNHVRVLSESNNMRGARIAEYKLQTLLEFAANHLLIDSISTEFKTIAAEDDVCDEDVTTTTTTAATKDERSLSLPIEMTVEIRSPRFFHEGLEAISRTDAGASPPHRKHQGKLTFRAKGKVQGERNVIGRSHNEDNDTDRCLRPISNVRRNSNDTINSSFENIDIDVDCNALLSQMMEEASKVVTMAVELTNLVWTNNTQKQEEINKMNMNDMMADNSPKTANIIVDDDDSCTGEHLPQRMTGKRSRCQDHADVDANTDNIMSKQVSDHFFRPPAQVVCDEEHIEEPQVFKDVASITTSATITNLHLLDQDTERKTRYFVSDPSYESSASGSDHDQSENYSEEKCQPEQQDDVERACHIVDFVLAGDILPCSFSSNKKLRTK